MIGAAIVHTILRRLLAIVDTVRGGDPFIARERPAPGRDRVERAGARGAAMIVIADRGGGVGARTRLDGFSFAPWLAVLLLFVLSGVFAQGARMRADLEGTV